LDDPKESYKPQALTISKQIFNGHQFSLFYNPNAETTTHPDLNLSWNCDYVITNEVSKHEVKVNAGVIQYIESFGFYEVKDRARDEGVKRREIMQESKKKKEKEKIRMKVIINSIGRR
jgi:hypothetical protein